MFVLSALKAFYDTLSIIKTDYLLLFSGLKHSNIIKTEELR